MIIVVLGNVRSLVIRGLAATAFGLLTLVWPGLTLLVLVILFGAYALVDGISDLLVLMRHRRGERGVRTLSLVIAIVSIGAGIITLLWPDITALALLLVIAGWALATGVLHLVAAFRLRRHINNEWLFVLNGIVTLMLGVILVITPGAGALAITWVIGWMALLRGVLLLALAWRVHRRGEARLGGAVQRAA